MRNPTLIMPGVIALSMLVAASVASADERPSAYDTKDFMLEWEQSGANLHAWQIEYQGHGKSDRFYVNRLFACDRRGQCFYRLAKGAATSDFDVNHIHDSWKTDVFQQWVLLRGEAGYWGQPFDRLVATFECPKEKRLPEKIEFELFLSALALWVFPDRPGPRIGHGVPCVKPDIISSKEYVLRPFQSLSDGRWCEVIESPAGDRMWLDVERGFMCLKREIFEPETGAIAQRILMRDARQVAPDTWIPWEVENERYDLSRSGDEENRRLFTSDIRVIGFKINEAVNQDLFNVPSFPPGTILKNEQGSFEQVKPDGHDQLDKVAVYVRQAGFFVDQSDSARIIPASIHFREIIMVVCSAAVMILVARYVFKRS